MYALCGIHMLNKESFDAAAKNLQKDDPNVTTMSGCMTMSEKASVIIQRIANGTYDVTVNSSIR